MRVEITIVIRDGNRTLAAKSSGITAEFAYLKECVRWGVVARTLANEAFEEIAMEAAAESIREMEAQEAELARKDTIDDAPDSQE